MNRNVRLRATFLLLLFLGQLFYPTASFALTGGPSQPEVESFEPITTDQMVDPFTGDFNYNLPLMTVPGPGGGYPINIAYHAGVSMDEEASWVGLGWNINPGVINRGLQGFPDDFNGEIISETTSIKPVESISLFGSAGYFANDNEFIGAEFSAGISGSIGATISIDNYRGIGLETNFGMNYMLAKNHGSKKEKSETTTTYEPSGDFKHQTITEKSTEHRLKYSLGFQYSSRSSTANFNQGFLVSTTKQSHTTQNTYERNELIESCEEYEKSKIGNFENHGSFSINAVNNTQAGNQVWATDNTRISASFGPSSGVSSGETYNLGAIISSSALSTPNTHKSYGYFYANNSERESTDLNDFYFDNDNSFSKKTPRIITAVANQDVFIISGQGVTGMFRTQKKGIGVFSENTVKAYSTTDNANPEYELGTGTQLGLTYESGHGFSRIGSLTGDNSNGLNELNFGDSYFKLVGSFNGHNSCTNPSNFNIEVPSTKIEISPFPRAGFHPILGNSISESDEKLKNSKNTSTNIEYFTHSEKASSSITNNGSCIFIENAATPAPISYNSNSSQIAEYKIRKTDGQVYVYGLPAMNTEQTERSFSVEPENTLQNDLVTSYEVGDASTGNSKGNSHFFYEKKTPEYAHTYMITQILSSDYIDRTSDGPTADDYGSYVKFSYTKFSNVKWRIPYYGANYSPGYLSDNSDDKASYIEGKKDIYFAKSIETKTHIAVFTISPRSDAHFAADGEQNSVNGTALGATNYKLDRIDLYQKNENGEIGSLIQSTVFYYDYSSCPGIPNFSALANESSIIPDSPTGGKLTLRKIEFTYGENGIIKETPYEFDYYQNPNYNYYNIKNKDKWNQPFIHNPSDQYENQINPYSNPYEFDYNANNRIEFASLFNLKSIKYPSGTKIKINYEQDEYAYVQDKRALTMLKITGIGDVSNTEIQMLNEETCRLSNDNRRIYFIVDSPISSASEGLAAVARSQENIHDIFFRLFLKLKANPSGGYAEDYVDCFAEFDGHYGFIEDESSPNFGYGYIDVKKIQSMAGGLSLLPQILRNPLRYSGIDYIQKERPELINIVNYNGNDEGLSVTAIPQIISSALGLVSGFMNTAALSGYCSRFSTNLPSYIRLNDSDNIKYGGGIRVKSIETLNNSTFSSANISNQNYTTHYYYSLQDGSSSGVAENEPSIGDEENALFEPIFFGSNKYLSLNKEQYIQLRAMRAFYPSPNVGYSRVLTFQSNQSEGDQRGNNGITEYLFNTAKDYPVKEDVQETPDSKRVSFTVPLVVVGGSIGFSNVSASQKFKVIINNMHGKPKRINSYIIPDDIEDFNRVNLINPTTSLEYEYFEDNNVNVLLDEFGTIQTRQIGVNVDGYFGERQRSSWDISGGADMNTNITAVSFLPSAYPQISYGEQYSRFLSSTAVVYQNAVLKSQTSVMNGISTKTENKLFDPNTGRVLVTETTIDGKDPITSFDIPAYWNYPILGAAGQNYRYSVNDGSLVKLDGVTSNLDFTISNGYITCSNNAYNFTNFFEKGDIILLNNGIETKYYWVIEVFSNSIYVVDQENTIPQNSNSVDKMIVMQSGFKNQQDFDSGSITISGKFEQLVINSVLKLINTELESIPVSEFEGQTTLNIPIDICSKLINFSFRPSGGNGIISDFRISTDEPSEFANTHFNEFISSNLLYLTDGYFKIIRTENGQFVLQIIGENGEEIPSFTSSPFYLSALNFRSLKNVINASAVEYSDEIPLYANNDFISNSFGNPYLNGTKGQWRPIRNYSYQGDRVYRQNNSSTASEGTNSHEDGLLFCFPSFVWAGDNTRQFNEENNWLMSNEITVYNPNGLALEERNALGIYSAQLTTVKENLVLCSGSNSKMSDIGCLSFEENSDESFNPGHLNLLGAFSTTTSNSHSGKKSLIVNSGTTDLIHFAGANSTSNSEFRASNSAKYLSQFWVKFDPTISTPSFSMVDNSGNSIAQGQITNIGKPIDGWYLVTVTFGVPNDGCNLRINAPQQNILIDDIRIQPLNSTMVTYVYDYQNYRLLAQLDNQNYATFYNYSLDGALTQVKRETASGVYTVNSMNQNTK